MPTETINKFFLDDAKLSLESDNISMNLSHEQSLILNVELLGIISDIKFYLNNVNLGIVTDVQIIKDLKQILEEK